MSAASVDSTTATILHVDLDAFFASVELLDHPELAGQPVVVAGRSARSVVTAANYPARKYGVRSAIPLSRALQLCPKAVVLEPHFEKYRHYSKQVMAIFDEMTPLVERLGIDEAFLDVSGARGAIGTPAEIGELIRRRVRAETGLTCSVGAASTKFVAKLASGRSKPDGMLVVPADDTLKFLHPLPVGALWGVGSTTEASAHLTRLAHDRRHRAHTAGAVATRGGKAAGAKLHDLSTGSTRGESRSDAEGKSIGHEVTFEVDVSDAEVLRRELLRHAAQVAERLRADALVARTVVLKLRYADFTTITRSRTLAEPTDLGRRIYDEVRSVYDSVGAHAPVRLIGVRAEQLSPSGEAQPGLWETDDGWREAELAIDGVSERFGHGVVGPASLLRRADSVGPSKRRPRQEDWDSSR